MLHHIYLGLGCNLGDRLAALDAACEALAPQVRVLRRSPVYETQPWGYADQPDFLNQVLEAETELSPHELLAHLKAIEKQLGRQPRHRNGPREIDVDILLYDDLQLDEERLKVPHPAMPERAFILAPLADLSPELRIPGQSQSVAELRDQIDLSSVRLMDADDRA